jgi:hypothetical protein
VVPVLEEVDSIDELKAAVTDTAGFLQRLAESCGPAAKKLAIMHLKPLIRPLEEQEQEQEEAKEEEKEEQEQEEEEKTWHQQKPGADGAVWQLAHAQPEYEHRRADATRLPSPSEHVHKIVQYGLTVAEEQQQERAAALLPPTSANALTDKIGHRSVLLQSRAVMDDQDARYGQDVERLQSAAAISLDQIDGQFDTASW